MRKISPTNATSKAVGLKAALESITSARPVQGPVEAPLAKAAREAKEGPAFLRQAEAVKRKERLKAAEGLAIRDVGRSVGKDKLKFDSIFGEVNVTMAPDIAARYQSGDPATRADILKMYHDQALEEGRKAGKEVVPRWKNTEAAKSYELGRTAMGIPSAATEFLARQAPKPFVPDERFNYQPYTPEPTDIGPRALRDIGNVGGALGDQLNAYFQNVPGGYAQFRRDNPDLFQGASNVMRGAAERTYEALPINPMLNLPGQFWESAADLLDPSASLGKTTMGAVGVGGALFPYAKGIGTASALLKAGSKYGPALEAGLNAAAREGIIGWSYLERNVRARDLANILEGTGAFASKAEKADFIKQIQKDAKEWASKNSKDANEFLEQEEQFYKDLIRPTLNDLVPQGVSPSVTRAANAAIGGPQFQPAVGQTLAPVTDTRRVSALAGELAIPEGNRYQQLIPDLRTDDEIEQAVMDVYTKLVSGGLPTNQATEVVANLARNLKQQVSQTPEKITVYHGTTGEFEGIPSAGMSRTGAIHVTPDKKFAENFTNIDQPNAVGQTPSIKEFQLDTTKIADLSQPALKQSFIEFVVNKYGLKRDPFDPEFTTINTRTFDPEGYNYPNGMTVEDLADDIDKGQFWIAESEAAKEWAKANGYAGVRAVEDGTETFAIFDNSALGAKKAASASSTFIDNLDTKIAQLEQETKGRMYSGIDPALVQLYALKAFREVYRGGVQAFRAVKAVMGKDADDVEFYKAVSERLKEFLNRNKTELISRKAVTLSLQPGNEKTDIVDLVEAAIQEAGIDVTKDAKKTIVEMASKMYIENAYTRPFKKVGPDKYKVSAEDLKQQAFRAEDGKIYVRLHPGYDTLNGGVYTTLGGRQIMLLGGSDYPLFDDMYGTVATSNKGKGSATALLKETKNTPLVLISLLKNDNLLNSPLGSSLFFEDMADLIAGSVKGADGKPIKITEQEIVTTLQKLFEGIGKDKWLKRRGPDGKLIDVDAKTITTLEDWKRLVQQTFDNGATFKEQLLKRDKRIKKAKEPGARVEVFTRPAEEIIDMASNPEQRFSQPGTVVSAIAVDPIVGSAEYFGIPDHVSFPHVQAGLGLGDTNHVSLIDLFPEEWQKYKGMAEGRYQKYLDATDAEKKAFDDAIRAAKSDKGTTVPEADIVEDELEKGILIGDRPDAKTVKENKLSVEQVKEAWGMQNSLPQPAHFITKVQKGNDKFELTERGIDLLTGRGNIRQDILPADVNAQGAINDQPGVGGKIRTSELMGGGRSRKEIGRTPEQIAELEQKNLSRTAQLEEQVVQSEARQAVGKEVRAAEKKLSELAEKPLKNIEKNQAKIAELKEIIKSQKRSLSKNRQRGAYIPPTKEEIELLARTALDTVYRTGGKVVDTVKNMVRYLDLQEEDVNKIYDSIRGLDQEVGKEIPTVQATVPPTDLPDLVATANRITEEVRKSVGLDGATKATPEQIADWTEEARKINTSKLMNDMMSGTGNLRPLSKAEELAVGARLSRALERYSSALDELRATDTPSSELLDRIDSARDEIDEISKFSLAVGTEWGKAGVARQALIRADYTTAGVITRIKKKEKLLSKDSSMAIQATKQEMADAEEFARISREKDDKIAALEKKIEDLKAQGAKEAPKRRQELRRQKLESERDDILKQMMAIRKKGGVKQSSERGAAGINVNPKDNFEMWDLIGKLAKNHIQRGALDIEDVYAYVSEVVKQAGYTITKQGMIDALDAQMLKNRRVGARRATKAELRARQRLYREVERGATRNVAEREREIAAKEAARKAREEAIQIKKDEIAAKKQAIRAEREAQKATSKAEADAYRAAAKQAREEARALAKQLREAERKAKLDARQARRAELTEALGPIARDERKIANLKGRIEDYNRMIETGEFFASRALKEGDEGYELTHLQTQLEQLRYEAKVAKQNVDTIIDDLGQPAWKKVLKEVIELPRYMQLGLDAGALTRQGFDIALVSPTAWTKAAKQGFGAAISNPAKVARLEEEFMRDPEVLKAIANGLAIDGPSAMPEGFVSKAAQKIPLYGRGERFHKTFQNFARYETYRNLTRGQNMNQYQLKETAKLINAMTGRGSWSGAQGKLASIFTAPKMYAGQLEVMGKTATAIVDPRFRTNPAYRKLIVRRWLGRMAGIVALKALADATDWEFSINPDDSDFLKLRNGNTVIDVTGGYSSWYKLLFSTLNDIAESGASEPFVERLQRSLGYKISPTYRTPLSLITGKDAIGKPFFRNPDTGEREINVQDLAKTFAPLIGMQIYEMAGGDEGYADMDNPAKVALGGLSFIGTGVSNYEAKEPSRKPEDTKWGQFLESIGRQPR